MDCTIDTQSDTYEQTTVAAKIITLPTSITRTSSPPKVPSAQRSQKRVHFSTQNSMVQVPRSDLFHYDELPSHNSISESHKNDQHHQQQQQQFGYESVYSNEYEPIGSEGSIATTNLYVDMDAKPDNDRIFKNLPKQPPALPPKPSNLLKIRNVVRNVSSFGVASPLSLSGDDIVNETEPDYASILEVSQPTNQRRITQEVQVEVHKSDADSESKCNSVFSDNSADESFADVPKLPNVAAIISPKKDFVCPSTVISQDNYITRSPVNPKPAKTSLPPGILTKNNHNQRTVSNGTSSMSQTSAKANPSLLNNNNNPSVVCPVPVYEDKLQLQAEFDWYNLDVEYSCKTKSDLSDELDDRNVPSVEYKLDEEYIISTTRNNNGDSDHHFGRSISHEETIVENDRDEEDEQHDGVTIQPINGLNQHHQQQQPQSHKPQTPTHNPSLYKPFEAAESFESFLKERGLATKPLPRKRKIFY